MRKIIYTLLFIFISVAAHGQAKYVFYFIGDGMGVNQVNGTEMYQAELNESRIGILPLQFTQFPIATMATTFSSTNSVTDSSAAGSALATGHKTYNHAVSVDMNKQPIETLAEKAKKAGKKVGIATTVSIDHATPSSFYAHQEDRDMAYEIGLDLAKSGFDFFAGSGFVRTDKTFKGEKAPHLFSIFEKAGYTIARGYDEYLKKAPKAEKIILIQKEGKSKSSLPYLMDRNADDLSLTQITQSAIETLTKGKDKGFFLMIEGGKIDWACHNNDAATVFSEIKEMDDAVKIAYNFYKKHPKETLIVVTADHETGGFALGKGGYNLNLKALQYQKHSTDGLSKRLSNLRKTQQNQVSWEEMKEFLAAEMGFWKELPLTWKQERKIRDEFEESFVKNKVVYAESLYSKNEPLADVARSIINDIAMTDWAHGGHSAGYVPVYVIGAGAQLFNGKIDNTEIPKRIAKAAGY